MSKRSGKDVSEAERQIKQHIEPHALTIDNARKDTLVVVRAKLSVDGRERINAGSRENSAGDVDHLQVFLKIYQLHIALVPETQRSLAHLLSPSSWQCFEA